MRELGTVMTAFVIGVGIGGCYVGMARAGATQAHQRGVQGTERERCEAALKQGLIENTPGAGWEVVVKIPGGNMPSQRVCESPRVDREKRQVICETDVVGVGDQRTEDFMRWVSR